MDAVDATCCTVTHGLSRKPVNLGKTKETDCWGSHFPSVVGSLCAEQQIVDHRRPVQE